MKSLSVKVALVIPVYRVRAQILRVIAEIGPVPAIIYVVDDACPEGSGIQVERKCTDSRVKVIYHDQNQGVGAAVMTGFHAALQGGAGIIVKLDGDGQMDPTLLPTLVDSIQAGRADYVKGNRFHALSGLGAMPPIRIFGNTVLSFLAKASTGYWQLFDPTNGYIAIESRIAAELLKRKLSRRYFFETDILFHLYLIGAAITEIPHQARYGDEKSNLRPARLVLPFLRKHFINIGKRLFFTYFLRGFYHASVELLVGVALAFFSLLFATHNWYASITSGIPRTSGTVVIASTMIIIASQCLLAFLNFDINNYPKRPIASYLPKTIQNT